MLLLLGEKSTAHVCCACNSRRGTLQVSRLLSLAAAARAAHWGVPSCTPKTPTNKKPSRVQEYISNIIAKRKRSKAPTSHTNHSSSSSHIRLPQKDVAMDDVESENAALQPEDVDVGEVVLPTHINDVEL
eukprot:scaffold228_cov173-Alexandrium_tamarense.AAC.17